MHHFLVYICVCVYVCVCVCVWEPRFKWTEWIVCNIECNLTADLWINSIKSNKSCCVKRCIAKCTKEQLQYKSSWWNKEMQDANNGIKTCLTQHIVRSISIIASENVCDTRKHTHTQTHKINSCCVWNVGIDAIRSFVDVNVVLSIGNILRTFHHQFRILEYITPSGIMWYTKKCELVFFWSTYQTVIKS